MVLYLLFLDALSFILCIRNHKIDFLSLVIVHLRGLSIKHISHFFVLHLIQNPLKELCKLILAHNSLWHRHKSCFGLLSHILTCILQIFCQLNKKFIIFFEKQNVVIKLFNYKSKTLANFKPLQIRTAVHDLHLQYLQHFRFLAVLRHYCEAFVSFFSYEVVRIRCSFYQCFHYWD